MSRESTACTNLCALQGFLKKRSPQEAATLRQLYAQSFPDLYRFSVQNLEYKTDLLEAFVIAQSTHMLQGLIPPKVNRPAPWRRSPLLSEPHRALQNPSTWIWLAGNVSNMEHPYLIIKFFSLNFSCC